MPSSEPNRIVELFSDFFLLGTALKAGTSDNGDARVVRAHLLTMFGAVDQRGEAVGISRDVIAQAKFALAAFLDEMVMTSRWREKRQWTSQLLQYELFQTQSAGVEFFDRLDAVRRQLPLNAHLLETYYLCLVLGFQGRYAIAGREKLSILIGELRRDLEVKQGEVPPLSPHAKQVDEVRQKRQESIVPLVLSGACCVLALLVYVLLGFMVGSNADEVAHKFDRVAHEVIEGGP